MLYILTSIILVFPSLYFSVIEFESKMSKLKVDINNLMRNTNDSKACKNTLDNDII